MLIIRQLGFVEARALAPIRWWVVWSNGVCRVRMSTCVRSSSRGVEVNGFLLLLSPSFVLLLYFSRSSRGGSHSITLAPHSFAYWLTSEPTLPTPTTPIVSDEGSRNSFEQKWLSAAANHCNTARELQPAARSMAMLLLVQKRVSMWSNPIVAEATIFTDEPLSRVSLHRVRVRVIIA